VIIRRSIFYSLWLRVLVVTATLLSSYIVVVAQNGSGGTVLLQPRVLTPEEYLTGDTSRSTGRSSMPGEVSTRYSRVQDSLYKRALSLNVSSSVRFSYDIRSLSAAMTAANELTRRPTQWENIARNMAIPDNILAPTAAEITQYKINIANSMRVPGVLMYPMGTGNFQAKLGDIGKLLGMVEDVSPRIRYVVDETIEISVVIYSTQAIAIATIFRGIQVPGAYEITWNGRDDSGKPAPRGDYVAEVRLGFERLMRKRILWPPE